MPFFFVSDLIGTVIGLILGVLFFVMPGFVFGWWLDLLGFRSQPPRAKLILCVPFSLAVMPIFLYLFLRIFTIEVVWLVLSSLWLAAVVAIRKSDFRKLVGSLPRPAIFATICWALLAGCTLLDIKIGNRVYFSWVSYDLCLRTQVTSALARARSLPITNMMCFPGHPVPFRYHYFAFLIPSFIERLGFGHVSAFCALLASIIWYGVAVLATIAAFARFFFAPTSSYRTTIRAWCLLLVMGPHILVVAFITLYRWRHGAPRLFVLYEAQQWNHAAQVTGWVASGLWVPNHVAALVTCLVGCLLLWHLRTARGWRSLAGIGACAAAFASSAGLSVFVTMIFAAFLVLLTIYILGRNPQVTLNSIAIGALALLMALPFLLELRSVQNGTGAGGRLLGLEVRRFVPLVSFLTQHGWTSPSVLNAADLLALPVNYLAGFGLFLVSGIVWWQCRRRGLLRFSSQDKLSIAFLCFSLLLCTFIRSFPTNDFGWRGLLPVQFILLFWSAELIERYRNSSIRASLRFLIGTMLTLGVLGVATTLLDVLMLRSYTMLVDSGSAMPYNIAFDERTGERHGALREAYAWIRKNSAPDAVIEQNPNVEQTLALGLYSERQAVLFGPPGAIFGGDQAELERTFQETSLLFIGADSNTKNFLCDRYRLNYIIVQEQDPVWQNPWSYVWTDTPVFSSRLVRVFQCRGGQR